MAAAGKKRQCWSYEQGVPVITVTFILHTWFGNVPVVYDGNGARICSEQTVPTTGEGLAGVFGMSSI